MLDAFSLALNSDAPPGTYRMLVGIYNSQSFENLPVIEGHEGQTVIELTTITVP